MANKFEVMIRRQPGYELQLTVRFAAPKAHGVLSLARAEWKDKAPSGSFEIQDVSPAELRGGRFTLIHPSTERREGYSLARITEELLAKISDAKWTVLDPITEFGFRYLEVPANALTATPAAAAVRTRAPDISRSDEAPMPVPVKKSGGSLLDRARHGASGRTPAPAARTAAAPLAVAASASLSAGPIVETDSPPATPARKLPPRPAPVASASSSGTPLPQRRAVGPPPNALPGALPERPVPLSPSIAAGALQSMSLEEAVVSLRAEMQKVWELHLRLEEMDKRLADSAARERDLMSILGTWQERMLR